MDAPKIFVSSQQEADDLLSKLPGSVTVICLKGSKDPGLVKGDLAKAYTEIVVDDLQSPLEDYVHPTIGIARQIVAAWEQAKARKVPAILICCYAGIARSPAVALALLYYEALQQDPLQATDHAVQKLLRARPICLPNRLLLQVMLEALLPKNQAAELAEQLRRRVEGRRGCQNPPAGTSVE